MPKIRRTYAGAAVSTTITANIAADTLTIDIAASTGWASGYFYAVIDPGTSSEEKVLVASRSGLALTISARGVDGTTAKSHTADAVIYPVHAAVDSDEANELTSTYANQGGIVYQGSTTFTQLGIGSANHVLKVNSGATAPEWGQIAAGGIATDAVTSDKIIAGAVGIDELAAAVVNKLVPVGTIAMYGGASAPTGWLLCDGSAINAGYSTLISIVGANTPDFKGRFPIGDNASLTLLGTGGSTTIAEANLPSHSHGSGTLSTSTAGSHSHSGGTGYAGIHQHDYYKTTVTQRAVFNADLDTTDDVVSTYSLDETSIPNEGDGTHFHSIGADGNHSHSVNSGSTGTTGSGTAYYPPYLVVNYIIKHD